MECYKNWNNLLLEAILSKTLHQHPLQCFHGCFQKPKVLLQMKFCGRALNWVTCSQHSPCTFTEVPLPVLHSACIPDVSVLVTKCPKITWFPAVQPFQSSMPNNSGFFSAYVHSVPWCANIPGNEEMHLMNAISYRTYRWKPTSKP